MYACLHLSRDMITTNSKSINSWKKSICCKKNSHKCKSVRTFELGDFRLLGLLHFIVALFVFIQEPAVILALDLMLFMQLVILLLKVFVLVLKDKKDYYYFSLYKKGIIKERLKTCRISVSVCLHVLALNWSIPLASDAALVKSWICCWSLAVSMKTKVTKTPNVFVVRAYCYCYNRTDTGEEINYSRCSSSICTALFQTQQRQRHAKCVANI